MKLFQFMQTRTSQQREFQLRFQFFLYSKYGYMPNNKNESFWVDNWNDFKDCIFTGIKAPLNKRPAHRG